MPKFVIERAIPGIGGTKAPELQAISQKSCSVLQDLGPDVQWVQSYVTGDKIYCIYNAANEELVREHARRGGTAYGAAVVLRRVGRGHGVPDSAGIPLPRPTRTETEAARWSTQDLLKS